MKFNKIFTIALLGLTLSACGDDFLENKPQGALSEGNMDTPEAVDLLVNSAYATFGCRYADSNDPHFYPVTNWSYGEVRADNAYKGGGGETDIWEVHDMETAKIQPNNGLLDGKWFNVYCGISRCNSAIRALNKVDENIIKEKKTRIAEVYVIRCHWYFDLVRMFNRIPYMDIDLPETEYTSVRNDEFSRDQHLDRIANELLAAANDLPVTQPEAGRINRNIALAYAAKVKLYQAYEQNPETNAVVNINKARLQEVVDIIDQIQGYDLLADFQYLDLLEYENGVESVFAIQYSIGDGSSSVGRINWANLLNSMTGPDCPWQGDGFFLPSQDLINAYQTDADGLPIFDYQSLPDYGVVKFAEDDTYSLTNVDGNVDPRLDYVTGRPTIRYKTYTERPCGLWVRNRDVYGYNNTKRFWLSPESPDATHGWPWGASALNWQIIRYADLLLYKAEALIELGGSGLEEARTLINRVRQRAMNSSYVKDFYDPSKDAANYKIGLYPAEGWTQEYARQALRTEMRLEKAMEGERFFDLVRWGIAKETMNNYFNAEKDNRIYYQGAEFNDGEEYFPVPVAQYNFSGGIYTQNPGYPSF
ncbi:MAG: RagB/SusD family nutrient uptake outer membrane protein [Muribaculaceae bacterium]|nr:RagB/SusD family nutrient uptake outer membrane protein [Muribaculaceae bacterium]